MSDLKQLEQSLEERIYRHLCLRFRTPYSLAMLACLDAGDYASIVKSRPKTSDYLEDQLAKFDSDYLISSYFSKYDGWDVGIDTKQVALASFAASEVKCGESNRRIRSWRSGGYPPGLAQIFHLASRKISRVLGAIDFDDLHEGFDWGPGATYDVSRRKAQVDTKMTTMPLTVSGTAISAIAAAISFDLHWSMSLLDGMKFSRTDCCRVVTVPKSAKTDRTIAVEPTGNLFLQKGVGNRIRRRLKRVGIDLDDQSRNQHGALRALSDGLCTIDLAAASDSISRELVYELLPYDWASLLDQWRTHTAEMPDGRRLKLEKFSSMGNGFTFELETLIFWALTLSVCEDLGISREVLVYGDDIICPSGAYHRVVEVLNLCGFEVNKEKSFSSGLFYESCGRHYFNGSDVTPIYQKCSTVALEEAIRCHNRVVRWCLARDLPVLHESITRSHVGEKVFNRYLLPYGHQGDGGFLVDCDSFVRLSSRFDKNKGFRTEHRVAKTRPLPGDPASLYAYYLRKRMKRNVTLEELEESRSYVVDYRGRPTYATFEGAWSDYYDNPGPPKSRRFKGDDLLLSDGYSSVFTWATPLGLSLLGW